MVGRMGEDEACKLLSSLGHTILDRNWRGGHLEIDIISLDSKGLHFVEVKSRVAPVAAEPEENVTRSKQKKIVEAAERYLHGTENVKWREGLEVNFDIVSVTFDGDDVKAEYFPNAWFPMFA